MDNKTSGKGDNRRGGVGYEKGFERIFGKKEAVTSFKRFGKGSGERVSGIHIIPDIEPFVSPISGDIITTRSQLRQHNKDNGVTNSEDYSDKYFKDKQAEMGEKLNGATSADKADRIAILRERMG